MSRPPDDGGETLGRAGGRALSACPRGTQHSARARGSNGTAGHCPLESAGVRLRPAGLSLKPAMIMCSGQTGDRLSLVSRCQLQMCRTIGLGFRRRSSKPDVILRSRVGNGLQDLDGAGPAVSTATPPTTRVPSRYTGTSSSCMAAATASTVTKAAPATGTTETTCTCRTSLQLRRARANSGPAHGEDAGQEHAAAPPKRCRRRMAGSHARQDQPRLRISDRTPARRLADPAPVKRVDLGEGDTRTRTSNP